MNEVSIDFDFKKLYQTMSSIDIEKEGYIEYKLNLGYLQWAIAEKLFVDNLPEGVMYDFKIIRSNDNQLYHLSPDIIGSYVHTCIDLYRLKRKENGELYKEILVSKDQVLQILDNKNEIQNTKDVNINNIKISIFTMDDVLNTIQRCKVKNFHQFGLAYKLYSGQIKNKNIHTNNSEEISLSEIQNCLNKLAVNAFNLTAQQILDFIKSKNYNFSFYKDGKEIKYKINSNNLEKHINKWCVNGLV